MDSWTVREIEELRIGSISQVREKYREVFGEEPRSKHKDHLFRRLAWRLQALAEGGLSERARSAAEFYRFRMAMQCELIKSRGAFQQLGARSGRRASRCKVLVYGGPAAARNAACSAAD
jgi:Protein of unknown function (DUF2924)